MAFTRATGKHRAPSRLTRRSAKAVGVAALATTGVIGGLATPALAADSEGSALSDTGLNQVIAIDKTLAERIDAQADAQRHQADAAAKAEARREAEANPSQSLSSPSQSLSRSGTPSSSGRSRSPET
ncbi:M23 family peptidase, partial [Streptomyces sp. NPDC088184]